MEMIKKHIKDYKPDILIIPESQIKDNEKNLDVDFKSYVVENKFMTGLNWSRISILIKENVEYERLHHLENPKISTIWIKVKIGQNKYINIMGGYRQWKLPRIMGEPLSCEKESQISRFKTISEQIKGAKRSKNPLVIGWDSNIDVLLRMTL